MLCEKLHNLFDQLGDARSVVQIMEVCGTHTMSIASSGLRSLLPTGLTLTSGPGCPVCVTDQAYIDQAVFLARSGGAIIATYGDMVRVPGSEGGLGDARAGGAEVEVVYSADQAVTVAAENPDKEVVFLAVGFETTSPGTAMAVLRASREGLDNFSILSSHKLILPAMRTLLAGGAAIDGFLCPGHVSVILGWKAYEPIVRDYGTPCVVAGFDPGQVVAGLEEILAELIAEKPKACSVYPAVAERGNVEALGVVDRVFTPCDAVWRALGEIPASGLKLRKQFAGFDAAERFELPVMESYQPAGCRCGEVITGRCAPVDCGLFAGKCTPRSPVGPCMVSSEGACAAAYKYERRSCRVDS